MSQFPDTSRSAENIKGLVKSESQRQTTPAAATDEDRSTLDPNPAPTVDEGEAAHEAGKTEVSAAKEQREESVEKAEEERKETPAETAVEEGERQADTAETDPEQTDPAMSSQVMIAGDTMSDMVSHRPRLVTSNSGADIMLGLETDDGKTAEVEIDSLESDELQPEEIPKGRVRKTSIVEKLSKSKESEQIALTIMESAGQRQRDFEKLINEHQEIVHEISRTPSSENIVQSDAGRDP